VAQLSYAPRYGPPAPHTKICWKASRSSCARRGGEEDREWRVRVGPMMMRRVAGVLEAVGGRGVGLGRGRLAQVLPPVVVVGLESLAITPRERERERERWGGALLRPSARLGEVGELLRTRTREHDSRSEWTFI